MVTIAATATKQTRNRVWPCNLCNSGGMCLEHSEDGTANGCWVWRCLCCGHEEPKVAEKERK